MTDTHGDTHGVRDDTADTADTADTEPGEDGTAGTAAAGGGTTAETPTGDSTTGSGSSGEHPAVSPGYARTQNLIAAGVLLLIGVAAAVMSASLGVGSLAEPEPGMWPLIVSVVLVAFSVVLLLQSGQKGDEQAFGRGSLIVVVAVVSLIAYAALFENIGFEVPTVAILMLWIKGLGRQSWITSLSVSFGSCAVIYAVFISALGVPLPHIVVF